MDKQIKFLASIIFHLANHQIEYTKQISIWNKEENVLVLVF